MEGSSLLCQKIFCPGACFLRRGKLDDPGGKYDRQHFEFEKSIRFNASNETREDKEILLKWQIRDQKAKVLRSEEAYIKVPALFSRWMDKVLLPEIDVFTEYVSYQAYDGDKEIAEGTVIFSYPKYFRYQDPELSMELQYPWLIVRAKAYAKSVEIQNEDQDMVLSDNYFDMNGGEKRVQILRGKPEGLKIRSVYDIR